LDHETLRSQVVRYFQNGNHWSLARLFEGLAAANPDICYATDQRRDQIKDEIASQVTAVVHEMLRCGILAPDLRYHSVVSHESRQSSHEIPLQITEYGRQVLEGDGDAVLDPTGFLTDLKGNTRGLSKMELSYLEESVRAFHLHLYRASLVMLGGASEALMARVIKGTSGKLPDGAKIMGELEKSILSGFRAWRGSLDRNRRHLPARSGELLQSVDHVFEIIRLCRNEAAHPKAVDVDRLEVQTLLLAFRRYARALLQLKRSMR